VLERRPGLLVEASVGLSRLLLDRALAALELRPLTVAVDQYAPVAQDVREQQRRGLRLTETDDLNAPAASGSLEALTRICTRPRAVPAKGDEEIEVARSVFLAARDAAEEDRERHVRLGAQLPEETIEEQPMPADVVVLAGRDDYATLAQPPAADRAAPGTLRPPRSAASRASP